MEEQVGLPEAAMSVGTSCLSEKRSDRHGDHCEDGIVALRGVMSREVGGGDRTGRRFRGLLLPRLVRLNGLDCNFLSLERKMQMLSGREEGTRHSLRCQSNRMLKDCHQQPLTTAALHSPGLWSWMMDSGISSGVDPRYALVNGSVSAGM